jgi:predicted DNA-binding protein (MmcQ/YjbR family)
MSPKAFHAAALALPGASYDVKWGSDRVYSIGGKMFATAGAEGDSAPKYSFKVSDLAYEHLIEQGHARPAPYLSRARWVQLVRTDALPDPELAAYLKEAHRIVAEGLTKRARVAVGA